MEPHSFPRRVLLCVVGATPQTITETLYALAVGPGDRPRFVPTEIRVLTTTFGAEKTREALLDGPTPMFTALCRDYGFDGIRFDASCIEVFVDADGKPMADIITPEDNEAAADHITRCVHELTRDPDVAIHASIAGGRKTMGYYFGYAMSLFGRDQDRVSHVLVSEGFNDHPHFFYVPPTPAALAGKNGATLSTADARIHLAEIPIVHLRSTAFEKMTAGAMGFREAVKRTNMTASGRGELVITFDSTFGAESRQGHAVLCGEPLDLSQVQVLVLHWMAERRWQQHPVDGGWIERNAFESQRGLPKNLGYLDELYQLAKERYGRSSKGLESMSKSLETEKGKQKPIPTQWFEAVVAKINRCIRIEFGARGEADYGIAAGGEKNALRYRLALPPNRIRIETD